MVLPAVVINPYARSSKKPTAANQSSLAATLTPKPVAKPAKVTLVKASASLTCRPAPPTVPALKDPPVSTTAAIPAEVKSVVHKQQQQQKLPRLSLRQEVEQLKRQQRLYKERLLLQKQQKKQRKLLKKQQALLAAQNSQLQPPPANASKENVAPQPVAAAAVVVPSAVAVTADATVIKPAAVTGNKSVGQDATTQPKSAVVVTKKVTVAPEVPPVQPTVVAAETLPSVVATQPQQHITSTSAGAGCVYGTNSIYPMYNYMGTTSQAQTFGYGSSHVPHMYPTTGGSIHGTSLNAQQYYEAQQQLLHHGAAGTNLFAATYGYGAGGPAGYPIPISSFGFSQSPNHLLHTPNYPGAALTPTLVGFPQATQNTVLQHTPSFLGKDIPAGSSATTVKPAPSFSGSPTLPAKTNLLAANPVQYPSPFAQTHFVSPVPIVLIKSGSQSFGVTLTLDMQSALVQPKPDSPKKQPPLVSETSMSDTSKSVQVQRVRKRRKRVFFSVIAVLDPTEQNKRHEATTEQLRKDDILLHINGVSTAGLSFQAACMLFRECQPGIDGTTRCTVFVARRNIPLPAVVPQQNIPSQIPGSAMLKPTARVGPLDPNETLALVASVMQAVKDPQRLLGGHMSSIRLREIVSKAPALAARGELFDVRTAWYGLGNQVEFVAKRAADAHWKKLWEKEPEQVRATSKGVLYLTDAQRSTMRALPRKAKGCKCGSLDHKYVNDVNCPLYSNLRRSINSDDSNEIPVDAEQRKRILGRSLPKDLNVVEKAFKDRLIRMKVEQEAEEAEARFVSKMEKLQLNGNGNQAIFAPSLTAMILSAVVELQTEFEGQKLSPLALTPPVKRNEAIETKPNQMEGKPDVKEEESDDEDDDVPLAALGKRANDDNAGDRPSKRQRGEQAVQDHFLARLLYFVSNKWGHVFREPSNDEYSWRWEVYHGQASDSGSQWDMNVNPRPVGDLSFQRIRFALDQKIASYLEEPDQNPLKLEALNILAHFLSPSRTGVYDELLALIRTNVLTVDGIGMPSLASNWWANVDFLLLEEMHFVWGVQADPSGKYGMCQKVRNTLHRKWARIMDGWAFAGYTDDIIYDFAEFDEWRVAYEEKQRARSDGAVGVGRFS